jgi:hypothetical protein
MQQQTQSLKPRWDSELYNINAFLEYLNLLMESIDTSMIINKRGRKPKRDVKVYISILIVKELRNHALRTAEHEDAELVCGERIDHSVINYLERKEKVKQVVSSLLDRISEFIEEKLSYDNSALDSTKFALRDKKLVEIHVLTRKAKLSLYASSFSFGSSKLDACEALKNGNGYLLADRWYDNKYVVKEIAKHGYIPIVKPRKYGARGYYGRLRDKHYSEWIYRLRAVHEGLFGALAVDFGDELNCYLIVVAEVRILCRLVCYNLRLLMRCYGVDELKEKLGIVFVLVELLDTPWF